MRVHAERADSLAFWSLNLFLSSVEGARADRDGAVDGHVAGNGRSADALERPSRVLAAAIKKPSRYTGIVSYRRTHFILKP